MALENHVLSSGAGRSGSFAFFASFFDACLTAVTASAFVLDLGEVVGAEPLSRTFCFLASLPG